MVINKQSTNDEFSIKKINDTMMRSTTPTLKSLPINDNELRRLFSFRNTDSIGGVVPWMRKKSPTNSIVEILFVMIERKTRNQNKKKSRFYTKFIEVRRSRIVRLECADKRERESDSLINRFSCACWWWC